MKNNKLLIWGTKAEASSFIANGYNGEIIGFIETHRSMSEYRMPDGSAKPVYDAKNMPSEYSYIIVANKHGNEIYKYCIENSIDVSKVIFLYGTNQPAGCIDSDVVKNVICNQNYMLYCHNLGLAENIETFVDADAEVYSKMNKRPNFAIDKSNMWECLGDKFDNAGTVGNYFWQDLWAAKLIIKSGVKQHFDIASRLDGFIAHLLAADVSVLMIDVRKFPAEIDNLDTIVDDATYLREIPDESVESMSALCSLEHFGLGRYGDPIDPEACFICFDNIQKKLKKGGKLYISVPIGKERVEFNSLRVFYPETIVNCFGSLKLEEFSCTADGSLEKNVDLHKYDNDPNNGNFRYGLFSFVKP